MTRHRTPFTRALAISCLLVAVAALLYVETRPRPTYADGMTVVAQLAAGR